MFKSKYFSDKELECGCGCGMSVEESFLKKLHDFREKMGIPFKINSAARCEAHNKAIGGSVRSMHLKGRAVDIKWDHLAGPHKRKLLDYACEHLGGVGLHKIFLHIDDRDKKTMWFY